LCGAINRVHPEAVKMLIDSGANVNTPPRKSDGFTPFTLAVSKCDTADSDDARDILQFLIEANAVPEGGSEGGSEGGEATPASSSSSSSAAAAAGK